MYRVTIKDLNGNGIGGFEKETIEEVNAYLELIVLKERPWHQPKEGRYDHLPVGAISWSEEVEIDEFGNEKTYYVLPKHYAVDTKDLSEDYDYQLQECYRKRLATYPDKAEYLDAKVKQASSDPIIREQGIAQEAAYCQACLQVKIDFPKPVQI